jgi:hypothetical protein
MFRFVPEFNVMLVLAADTAQVAEPGSHSKLTFVYEAEELPEAGEEITIVEIGTDFWCRAHVTNVDPDQPYPIGASEIIE